VAVGELDGRAIAVSSGADQTLRVWDLAAGAALGEPLKGHTDFVGAVAVGKLDGRAIAVSGGDDQTLRVWDLAGSKLAVIEVGSAIRAVQMRSRTILVAADAGVMAIDLVLAKPLE
jgi:WD40 repeat protein